MDAGYILARLAEVFAKHSLDAVMIGNAGAALQGAPVSTIDVDFYFRETPANLRKLKAVARDLDGVIFRPFYPSSRMYRISREVDGVQIDFMVTMSGIRSYEGLRSRSLSVEFGGHKLLVASLADIIKSKEASGRSKDLAVLPILHAVANEKSRQRKAEEPEG